MKSKKNFTIRCFLLDIRNSSISLTFNYDFKTYSVSPWNAVAESVGGCGENSIGIKCVDIDSLPAALEAKSSQRILFCLSGDTINKKFALKNVYHLKLP